MTGWVTFGNYFLHFQHGLYFQRGELRKGTLVNGRRAKRSTQEEREKVEKPENIDEGRKESRKEGRKEGSQDGREEGMGENLEGVLGHS